MEPFGSVRQQLWSILHFPFHLALALMMEGTNQILLCTHVVKDLFKLTPLVTSTLQGGLTPELLTKLTETVHTVYERFPSTQEVIDKVEESLHTASNGDVSTEEASTELKLVFQEMIKTIISGFGWEPPKEGAEEGFNEYIDGINKIFNLTFGISSYFLHPLFSPLSKPPVLTDILYQATSAYALVLCV